MLSKSLSLADCSVCPLSTRGTGFVQPFGPSTSPILFLGESPGQREAEFGEPLIGPAGGEFNRLLWRLGQSQSSFRKTNVTSCQPPYNKLEKMPWEHAIQHCRPNLDAVLGEGHRVIVTLGGVATREILQTGGNLKDFHGTVTLVEVGEGLQRNRAWCIPTFHPSHLLQGAHNLTGTVLFDIQRAIDVAASGWEPDIPTLYLDPRPDFFRSWVEEYLAIVAQDPLNIWLSVDVETADKERKLDEGELKTADNSMEITRVNLSYRDDEGLTVPFVGPYLELIGLALASLGPKWFWNKNYDLKRLWQAFGQANLRGPLLDGMDAWHALHSDVPKGLGFVAPFYSKLGAWKHLSASRPAYYAACDSVQNQRCCYGVARDLTSQGMWNVFWRHMHEVDRVALQPSCSVGLKLDPVKLEEMRVDLKAKSEGFYIEMQALVPDEIKPLHPKEGWIRRPEGETYVWPQEGEFGACAREILTRLEQREVQVCTTCGAEGVSVKHRCKDKALAPSVVKQLTNMPRFYVREDFNPGSPQQVLAYIKSCGHTPGHEKGKETTNRETLERLAEARPRSKKDEANRELYRNILDFREVKKILGTYVEGMLRRLEESTDGRVHPVVTNNPSTLRTAYNSPNLQNVVADKRGKASLATGFRKCIVAEQEA